MLSTGYPQICRQVNEGMFLAVSCHLRYNEIAILLYSVSLDTVVRSLEQYMQINAKTKDVVWNYLGIFFSLG